MFELGIAAAVAQCHLLLLRQLAQPKALVKISKAESFLTHPQFLITPPPNPTCGVHVMYFQPYTWTTETLRWGANLKGHNKLKIMDLRHPNMKPNYQEHMTIKENLFAVLRSKHPKPRTSGFLLCSPVRLSKTVCQMQPISCAPGSG